MFSAVVWSFLICEQMYFIIGLIVKRSIPTLNYYGRPKVLPFSIVQLYNCMPSNFVFTPLPHNSHQRPPHFLSPHKTLWPRFAATMFLSQVSCWVYLVLAVQLFNIFIGHSLRGTNYDNRPVLFSCNVFSVCCPFHLSVSLVFTPSL